MSEEDSDIEEDDNALQKFNENINTKFLEDIHTETKSINYDEMIALARVIRDKNGKIIDPLHKTLPFLTKYEKARIIGARAEQLDRGGESFIPLDETIINGRTIALMEFEAKQIPFIISRPLSNGSVEYWHLRDLEIL
jgi:DNA-directed RNA polymerase subunit K/omega